MAGSFGGRFDAVPWNRNLLAAAHGTSAGSGQFCPIAKHKPAVGTGGGFEYESLCAVPRQRLHHMRQMVLDQPFRNAQRVRQLIGREPRADQQLDDPLAHRAFGGQHGRMVRKKRMKTPARGSCM